MTEPRTHERTHYESTQDARYALRLNTLLKRIFGRLPALLRIVELASGTAAFAGYLGNHQEATGIAGLVIGLLAVINLVLKPAEKAAQADEMIRHYASLLGRAPKLGLEDLEIELHNMRTYPVPDNEWLRMPAYNDALREAGRTDFVTAEHLGHRLMRLFA